MKPENYLNVVEKLNIELDDADPLFYNKGLNFKYTVNNYVNIISFMGCIIFDSNFDEDYSSEEHLENIIRERMLAITNALCKWQKYDGF